MIRKKRTTAYIEPVDVEPLEPDYAEKNCELLEHAIHQIYDGKAHHVCFQLLDGNVGAMVQHNFVDELYTGLVKAITFKLKEMATSFETLYHGTLFLSMLHEKWMEHLKALELIRNLFARMDRYCNSGTNKPPILELGLSLWVDTVFQSSNLQKRLKCTLMDSWQQERNGEIIESGLMENIMGMIKDLGPSVYQQYEKLYIEVATEFYQKKSQNLCTYDDCVSHLKEMEKCLKQEFHLVTTYLDDRSKVKIVDVVVNEMIETYLKRYAHNENTWLVYMVIGEKYEGLGRIYKLLCMASTGVTSLGEAMTSHIKKTSQQLVKDPERLNFVQHILGERDKQDKIMELAFNNDKALQSAMNLSFKDAVRLNRQAAEDISLFLDEKLKKRLEDGSDEDFEILQQMVIKLFRDLDEKDVFGKYYKQHMAKRLLSYERQYDEDAERSMILKLKTECGSQFTLNMDEMLADMKLSRDNMEEFNNSSHVLADGPTFSVHVFKQASWPYHSTTTCNLPTKILDLHTSFQAFYGGKYSGRKLTWLPSMSSAVITATLYRGKKRELHVTAYQMCILVLFNDADQLTYRQIEEEVDIPTSDLKRCLQSLALLEGQNVLTKSPVGEEDVISEDDVFSFNNKFSSRHRKMKFRMVVGQRESEVERQEIREKLEVDRGPQVEAVIVRIMKSRRVLSHSNLVSDVINQLQSQFKPDPTMIKKSIEKLCERDYLKRDKDDPNLWLYMP